MKYPAYPDFRPVRSPNLRQLPAHWAVNRVKFIAAVGNGSTPSRDESAYWQDGTFPWLNSSVVNQEVVTDADQFVTALALRECHLPRVVPPAVLVGITGEGRTRGMATTLAIEATISQHLVFVKPVGDKVDERFLRRVFDASYDHLRSDSEGAGSTKGAITCEQIKEMALPVPPRDEQRAIAAFLDWRTAQIDALIVKKRALLTVIEEQRLSAISNCVMGNRSWPKRRLRTLLATLTSGSRGWAEYFADDGPLFLRITNLRRDDPSLLLDDLQRVNPPVSAEGLRTCTQAGDLLVSITADLGSVAVIPNDLEPAYVSQHLALIRLEKDKVNPHWAAYSMLSSFGQQQFQAGGYGGTKVQLGLDDIKEFVLYLPPSLEEQDSLVGELAKELGRLKALKEQVGNAINRLTEYRSALITAAVTGQIDVRGVKVPAPV